MDNYICTAGSVIDAHHQSIILESAGAQKYLGEDCVTSSDRLAKNESDSEFKNKVSVT